MTSLHDSITIGQQQELTRILVAAGMDPETYLALLREEQLAGPWVDQLKAVLTPPPNKHQLELFASNKRELKLFVSNELQLEYARMWWRGYLGSIKIRDAERQMANLKVPAKPLQAWVLCPSFSTIAHTLEHLWLNIQESHSEHKRSSELKSEAGRLRLLEGITFEKNCLKWVLIDFGAHLGLAPDKVRSSDSVHAELLAAVLQHPNWAKSMGIKINGILVPYVNLCGYQSLIGLEWLGVPKLRCQAGKLSLNVGFIDGAKSNWACPVRLGVSS